MMMESGRGAAFLVVSCEQVGVDLWQPPGHRVGELQNATATRTANRQTYSSGEQSPLSDLESLLSDLDPS